MYRISQQKRKYSPTPIVRVTVGADGKEQEEIVLIACGQGKKAGDELSARIVTLLNSNVGVLPTEAEVIQLMGYKADRRKEYEGQSDEQIETWKQGFMACYNMIKQLFSIQTL
jgi:hypothetical protein